MVVTFQTVPPVLTQGVFNAERQAFCDALNALTSTGIGAGAYTYLIRKSGADYEAYNSQAALVYGGSADAGGVDGADPIAVINAAITSTSATSGKIYIPACVIPVATPIIMKKNVELYGDYGSTGTGLCTKFKMAADCNCIEYNALLPGAEGDCSLHDFIIDGDSRSWVGDGIHFENVAVPTIRNIRIDNVKGCGVYFYDVWGAYSECLSHVCANNCGVLATTKASFYIGGSPLGCSNLHITNIGGSVCDWLGLYVYGAELKFNHVFFDTATNAIPLIRLVAVSHGICMNDVDVRVIPAVTNAIDCYARESKWGNVHVEWCKGTAFSLSQAGATALIDNITVEGTAVDPCAVGLLCQAATANLIVSNYAYQYTTTPSNASAGTLTITNSVVMGT